MKTMVEIEAGICRFRTSGTASSDDGRMVRFEAESGCEKIRGLAASLDAKCPIDAFGEISPASESVLMSTVRETLKGCCAGCAMPVGLFKALQVAAELALRADIAIRLSKDLAWG